MSDTPSLLRSVLGPVAPDVLGTILAAEFLLRWPRSTPGNAGIPATEAEFERRAVDMSMLGRLMMGARNLDDRRLGVADVEGALRDFASACGDAADSGLEAGSGPVQTAAVVALAPVPDAAEPVQDPASLAALSRATGVIVVRGVNGAAADPSAGDRAASARAAILADLGTGRAEIEREAVEGPAIGRAGVVGLVPADDDAVLAAGAEAAAESGVALVLAPPASLAEVARALDRAARAGLDRSRVVVTGASALIAGSVAVGDRARHTPGGPEAPAVPPVGAVAPRLGVDSWALDGLLDLGAHVCFDDLGRIPSVRTVVSDHDVALAILRSAERGAGDRILLSSGIRQKHRLTAFGGNGLEFVPQQFLPYLRMCGASDELVRAVGGGNAARVLAAAPCGTNHAGATT